MNRIKIGSGSPWEDKVGYSRAIRVGNIIEIAGTTAVENGKAVGINDPYSQTLFILKKIEAILSELGASIEDIVRTRMYVTNISHWEEIGKAHGEFFRNIKPVATMVEVNALIDKELLVEIEISAVIRETAKEG